MNLNIKENIGNNTSRTIRLPQPFTPKLKLNLSFTLMTLSQNTTTHKQRHNHSHTPSLTTSPLSSKTKALLTLPTLRKAGVTNLPTPASVSCSSRPRHPSRGKLHRAHLTGHQLSQETITTKHSVLIVGRRVLSLSASRSG